MSSVGWEIKVWQAINTLRPRQDGRYFADDVLKCIFLNENVLISLKIPLKFVPMGPINNIPAMVQIMAWRRPGDKPLSEPMMVSLLTHICATRPQWVTSNKMMANHNSFVYGCTYHVFIMGISMSQESLIFLMGISMLEKMIFTLKWHLHPLLPPLTSELLYIQSWPKWCH